ncbi:recombinase family protein [Microbacteriaceae bacterium 4G12]
MYSRLSVSRGDAISDSIRRQEGDLRALAAREGWDVVATLADDGFSGRKARAKSTEALRMLKDGEADVLAVWRLDRWTRQGLTAAAELVSVLDARPGSLFVAAQEGIRSDQPQWRVTAVVLSETARAEAENTSARVRSSIQANRAAGRFVGGTVPFGYRPAPRSEGGRTLIPHPPEVAVVREVAERLLGGESQASVIADLTRRGVATTRSKHRLAEMRGETTDNLDRGSWSYAGLAAVWTGESLLGRVSRSRAVTTAEGRPAKVWELVRDANGAPLTAYEPLLDLGTVERLRAHLRNPKSPQSRRDPERRTRRARLLSGVIFCECGQRLWVTVSGGGTVYTCARRAGRCIGPNIKAENAERAVAEAFLGVAGAWPEVEEVERVTAPDTVAALTDLEVLIRQTSAELAEDGADGAAILRRVTELKARRAELQAVPSSITVETVPTGRTLAEAWQASTVEQRRHMLLLALDHVILRPTATKGHTGYHPERITVVWNS